MMVDLHQGQSRRLPKLPVLAIVAGIILIVAAVVIGLAVAQAREQRRVAAEWERHTYETMIATRDLLSSLQDAETGNRGYLLIGSPEARLPYDRGIVEAPKKLARLKKLTADDARQQVRLGQLSEVIDLRLNRLRTGVELTQSGDRAAAIRWISSGQGVVLMDRIRAIITDINRAETELLKIRTAQTDRLIQRTDWLISGLLLLMAIMATYALLALISATRAQARNATLEAEQDMARQLKAAGAEAERSSAIVAALGDAVPDLIYAKDRDGRMTYANPATLAVIGKSFDDVIGRVTAEYTDDPFEAARIDENDARVIANGTTDISDEHFTSPDGSTRTFRSTKTPLRNSEGEIIGLAGVTIDVTAERFAMANLKASEERFRSLSETVPAFIFITDDKGEVTYTNREFQEYTGKSDDELSGMGWARAVHRDDRSIPEQAWARAVVGEAPYSAEYRFRRNCGEYRTFKCRGTPVRDGEGKIRQWIGTCSDVQEEINTRKAIQLLNQELEAKVEARTAELQTTLTTLQSEVVEREAAESQLRHMQRIESIGQLTGGIAHDFNNMLAVVLGSLEIVKRRIHSHPDRALAAADNAEEGAKRAALLTARLLAFSRKQPLAPAPLDANKLVSGMSELLRRTLGEAIEIETVLAGGLWKTHIDAPQLENAILNLCVNARDAMIGNDGGGKLTIETHNCSLDDNYAAQNADVAAGQYVLVSVTDTGTGMPAEIIERAFDPFYTTKEVGKGTGLGLSQVHGFVKQSGGHIKIYSEENEGTTVKIYLPRSFSKADSKPSAQNASTDERPLAKEGEVVLVVEDEAQVRQVSVEQLRDLGYEVIEATNGVEALELLKADDRIDLLFTDIVMPGMTGRTLADEAAKQCPDLKILYTTGYTRNAVVHNGVLDPNTQFLAKPFTGSALANKVRSVLDGK